MQDVKRMAAQGAVFRHPAKYHAHEKNLRFEDIAYHLNGCFYVDHDRRVQADGRPRFPDGYVAKCDWKRGVDLRVDFELGETAKGDTVLVVTAMELVAKGPP